MTARQRTTTGLGTVVLVGSLVASLAFMPAARAGEVRARSDAAAPTLARDQKPAQGADNRAPGDLAREGLAKMLQALDKLVESIPQYQLPEITEHGDIILRRRSPERPARPGLPQPPDRSENRAI